MSDVYVSSIWLKIDRRVLYCIFITKFSANSPNFCKFKLKSFKIFFSLTQLKSCPVADSNGHSYAENLTLKCSKTWYTLLRGILVAFDSVSLGFLGYFWEF